MLVGPSFAPPSDFEVHQNDKEAEPHEFEDLNSEYSDFDEETNYHVVAHPELQDEKKETKEETEVETFQNKDLILSSTSSLGLKEEKRNNPQQSDWRENVQNRALAIGKSVGKSFFISYGVFLTYFQFWKAGEWFQAVLAGLRDWVCAPLMDFLFSILCLFVPWSDKFPLWIFLNSSGLISLFWSRLAVLTAVFLFAYCSLPHFLHLGSYLAALNATFTILSQARKNIKIQAASPSLEIVPKRQKRFSPKGSDDAPNPNPNPNPSLNSNQPQAQAPMPQENNKISNSHSMSDTRNKSSKKESKQHTKKKSAGSSSLSTMNALASLCGIWLFYSFISDFIDPHLEQKFLLYCKCVKTLILFLLTKKVATQITF